MAFRYQALDQSEAEHAIKLFDKYVAIWNSREKRGLPGERGPLPAAHIFHPSFRRRIFTDKSTDRVYQITLHRPQFFFLSRPSGCLQSLDPANIREVRRIVSFGSLSPRRPRGNRRHTASPS